MSSTSIKVGWWIGVRTRGCYKECPVGIVKGVDVHGISIQLMSWLDGGLMEEHVWIPWENMVEARMGKPEDVKNDEHNKFYHDRFWKMMGDFQDTSIKEFRSNQVKA